MIANSPTEQLSAEAVQEIAVAGSAQQRFLQGEYANLLVNSSFDSQTAKLFRQLQKNTSSFPPAAIANLQTAATISAAANFHGRGLGTARGRFTGRGRYGSSFRGRGNSRDIYTNMYAQNSGIPTSRPDHDEDH